MMSVRDYEYKQPVFVFTNNEEKISFKNDNLLITDKDGNVKHQSTCYRLSILFICGDFCLTTGVIERAKKFGFSIIFMTPGLRVKATMLSKAEGNVLLRKKQYEYNSTEIASHIISNKIHNQCALLKKKRQKIDEEKEIIKKLKQYENEVIKPNLTGQEIMGIEGVSAKIYFKSLFSKYDWKKRAPQTKIDKINTLMDIGYTILFNFVDCLLEMYGFDTYVGILHTQFYHRKSLTCDMVEPFRPIIDATILKALNLGQVDDKDFWKKQNQYILLGKDSAKYVGFFISAIMEYKTEIFVYIQTYFRAFIQNKKISEFPVFDFEENTEV